MRKNIITKMCFENKMCFCSAFQIILRLKTYHQTTSNQHNYPLPFLFPILCSFLRMQGAWSRWFGLITEVPPSILPLPTFLITFRQNLYQCGVKRNCATFNINPWRIFIKSLNKVVKFEENTNDCEIQSKYKSCNIVEYVSSGDKDMF